MFPDVIVVPLDGSDFAARALPVARSLAWRCEARIDLVTTSWDGDLDAPTEYVTALAAAEHAVDVRPVVVPERAAPEAIETVVHQGPGRLVCMTTHGRGRMRWAVLGSVAEKVVHDAAGPVLLVGRDCEVGWANGLHRLLLCIDEQRAMPAVLADATAWAQRLGLDVVAATVFHPQDPTATAPVLERVVADLEEQGVQARSVVLRSTYPAGALADFVDAEDVDVVAMSTHARTGPARLALGSVTMGVVGMAHRPVLVVRND